jgi:2-keto-4-pentenoate hydratase/2-oxohepta-3-ene-1,7-dioic acid hydratase in catechol pathway
LEAPVLNPPKLLACAVNYAGHEEEMHDIQERVGGTTDKWILQFDVFLKATSSIIGPKDAVVIPEGLDVDREIHHECELAFIIGKGGSHIEASSALDHVFGYTVALDMTLRGEGDRSRRKSYDTFTPLGPWVVTSDEVPNPHELEIHLDVNGRRRQAVNTAEMLHDLPEIISYASSVMSLSPGDVVLTGAPPGVGPVAAGDVMNAEISKIGRLVIPVRSWLG